jgi:hypothetical protein
MPYGYSHYADDDFLRQASEDDFTDAGIGGEQSVQYHRPTVIAQFDGEGGAAVQTELVDIRSVRTDF